MARPPTDKTIRESVTERHGRGRITGVAHSVTIRIHLIGVGCGWAIVARVGNPVAIRVLLGWSAFPSRTSGVDGLNFDCSQRVIVNGKFVELSRVIPLAASSGGRPSAEE